MEYVEVHPQEFDSINGDNYGNLKVVPKRRFSNSVKKSKGSRKRVYIQKPLYVHDRPLVVASPAPFTTELVHNREPNFENNLSTKQAKKIKRRKVIKNPKRTFRLKPVQGGGYTYHFEGKDVYFENHASFKGWLKKRGAFAKGAAKKVAGGVGKIIKAVEGATIFLPLQPLRGMMLDSLKKAGHPKGRRDPIAEIVTDFYKFVVKKHPQYKAAKYEESHAQYYAFNDADDAFEANHADTIGFIVEAVLSFIKMLKSAKKHGIKVGKIGDAIIDGTDEAMNKAKEGIVNEMIDGSILGFVKSKQGLTVIGVSLIVVIIAAVIVIRR